MKKTPLKILLILGAIVLGGGLLFWVGWEIAVRRVSLPQEAIERWTPSVCFYDASGELIHVQSGYDHRWIFPVEYSEIPPELVRYVLAVEDRNFWTHNGFDFMAALRAVKQLCLNRRIVSGASTITMQTMTMFKGRSRTLAYKVNQILLACNWERTHSKEETLALYFNHLPFGGQIYGVEAAAQYYFGRHIGELNRTELVLLAGLPQSPTKLRPDRNPVLAIQRRDVVLHLLVRNGALTQSEADEIRHEPLRYRRFDVPYWPQQEDTHYFQVTQKAYPGKREYHLALDMDIQNAVLTALRNARKALPGVKDGAAVVVENATGRVRSLVGTLDFSEPTDGAVNAATAWRSPGSAFKPFIYGEAIYGGMITANTILRDEKILLDDYRPENFDGSFHGAVTAEESLADSLNTPAVRLLAQLGVPRIISLLVSQEVVKPAVLGQHSRIGLTLAIGGTETNLLNLTGAYARLAGTQGISFLASGECPAGAACPVLPWNQGSRDMLLKMLRHRPMPGSAGMEAAWKTGTSNGNRDAWCFAVTPEWTVGVWFGNKSGTASSALVGATAAAPAAAVILQALYRNNLPNWQESPEIVTTRLCAKTGLAPGAGCVETKTGQSVRGIPLAVCQQCGKLPTAPREKKTLVMNPAPGTYLCNQDDGLQIQVDTVPQKVHLYIDGEYGGMHTSGEKIFLPHGIHQITLWGGDGWEGKSLSLIVK